MIRAITTNNIEIFLNNAKPGDIVAVWMQPSEFVSASTENQTITLRAPSGKEFPFEIEKLIEAEARWKQV